MRAVAKDLSVRFKSWSEFSRELAQTYRHLELPTDSITDTQKYEAVGKLPFFADLSEIETWEIVRISTWHRHPPGKDIVKQGEIDEDFYLIVEGKAEVRKSAQVLDTLGPNDCFGELLYFEKRRQVRATTITATSELIVVKIKAQALQEATDALQKQFNKSFLRILVNRLAQVSDRRASPT
jgi:CRP-like cAMP-binding protein